MSQDEKCSTRENDEQHQSHQAASQPEPLIARDFPEALG